MDIQENIVQEVEQKSINTKSGSLEVKTEETREELEEDLGLIAEFQKSLTQQVAGMTQL